MDALPLSVWLLLMALAVLQAILAAAQAYEHRRFARSRLRSIPACRPAGRVILFVPCRGRDVGIEENLSAFFEQDYTDYEIRFLVESADDPVCRAIRRVAAKHPGLCARIHFTGKATDCGQKVHSLIQGTAELPDEVEYLAFADSDAQPRPEWLRALVSRLDRDDVGAATGYRWFVPVKPTIPNLLATSINASMGMFLGSKNPNIVWGGSWAIRRRRFDELQIRQAWRRKLNDDLVVTSTLRRRGLRIEYEPACAVASPLDLSAAQMVDFGRRQYLQGRLYLHRSWLIGLLLTSFSLAAFFTALAAPAMIAAGSAAGAWLSVCTALIIYAGWVYRGFQRVRLAEELFPRHRRQLRAVRPLDLLGGPLTALVNWMIFASSAVGRRIVWRGIYYRLDPGGNVLQVRHQEGRLAVAADAREKSAAATVEQVPAPAATA